MIYLVRHAESEWNRIFSRYRVDPGIPDPPLTEQGRRQAESLAEHFAALPPRRVVASPYRRALETAATIAQRTGAELRVEPLVRERCAFSCDIGSTASQLRRSWPQLVLDGLEEVWWGPLVESDESAAARARGFGAALRRHGDGPVIVVSHWGFIRALTGRRLQNAEILRSDWNALDNGEWWTT